MHTKAEPADFTVAYYAGNRIVGRITVVQKQGGNVQLHAVPTLSESSLEKALKPVFVGLTPRREAILIDPATGILTVQNAFPADAFAAHIYVDPYSGNAWLMNDGDADGNDRVHCGDRGSSVTVVAGAETASARILKTVCVGRGHHQAAFTAPSVYAPAIPKLAYISNLKDGTLSVLGNNPADAGTYLRLIATVNLAQADKENGVTDKVPNASSPHGLAYSPVSGKVYSLNSGYGTLHVVDPQSQRIEATLPFKGHSNLFMAGDGRYAIGRGADRKSDPRHVIARLSSFDVTTHKIVDMLELPDIYIGKYFINPESTKLYLTMSSSGSPEQQVNLKTDVLLVFDLTQLPRVQLVAEIKVGEVGSVAFVPAADGNSLVLCSDAKAGALVVVDGNTDTVLERIAVAGEASHSRVWTLSD